MATEVKLKETRGQHCDAQLLVAMHGGWIFCSSHLALAPDGGVAIGIRAEGRRFLRQVLEVPSRVWLCLVGMGGAPMVLGSVHIEPALSTNARRQRLRARLPSRGNWRLTPSRCLLRHFGPSHAIAPRWVGPSYVFGPVVGGQSAA